MGLLARIEHTESGGVTAAAVAGTCESHSRSTTGHPARDSDAPAWIDCDAMELFA